MFSQCTVGFFSVEVPELEDIHLPAFPGFHASGQVKTSRERGNMPRCLQWDTCGDSEEKGW